MRFTDAVEHPLVAAAGLVWRRKWALVPIVCGWAESFVSWPLALWIRGGLGEFHFSRAAPGLTLPHGTGWLPRAMETGAVAMLPVARAGWVSVLAPLLALAIALFVGLAPAGRRLEPGERPLLVGLSATGAMAAVGNLLGQTVWSRGGFDAAAWATFRMGGALLRTVVVPGTLGAVLLWVVFRPVTPSGQRQAALTRLSVMVLIGAALLGGPETLREGGPLGLVGRAWLLLQPLLGVAAALLAAWALRPAYVRDWLGRPTVMLALWGIAMAQVGCSGLRAAMPPVETILTTGEHASSWSGQLSLPGLALNTAIAAVQVAGGLAAIAALVYAAPERGAGRARA